MLARDIHLLRLSVYLYNIFALPNLKVEVAKGPRPRQTNTNTAKGAKSECFKEAHRLNHSFLIW